MLKRERISKLVGSELGTGSVALAEHPYFHEYFRLWNERRYYDAHDVLEQLWLDAAYAEHATLLKGMIQAAGAFVHLQKNFEQPHHPKHARRLRPAVRLFHLAGANLAGERTDIAGFDRKKFLTMLSGYAATVSDSKFTINPWTPDTAPVLREPIPQ